MFIHFLTLARWSVTDSHHAVTLTGLELVKKVHLSLQQVIMEQLM